MGAVANWWVFVAAFGFFGHFVAFEFKPRASTYLAGGKKLKTFDEKLFYTPSSVPKRLNDLAPYHAAYREQESTIDLIFPFVYGLMFASGLVGVGAPRWVLLVPLVAVVADYVENFTVISLLDRFPTVPGGLTYVLSLASAVKGAAFLASLGLLLGFAVPWFLRR